MLILALARRTVVAHRTVVGTTAGAVARPTRSTGQTSTRFNWGEVHGIRVLEGTTLGLVGFGEIAREVALRATALGMRVIFHQRSALDRAPLDPRLAAAEQVDLDELLATSDVVSLHVPGNAGTERMMDADAFARMRPGSFLVNMARGSIIDEEALEAALRSGHLAAAGLDVHREEPIPRDCGLLSLEEVVLSPHVAGGSADFVLSEVVDLVRTLDEHLREAPNGSAKEDGS
jgi:phosphoglycerate dehydrogenase-like enzyme